MIITRVGPLSFARISGFLYAIIGLIIGGVFSLGAMVGGFASDDPEIASFGPIIGAAAVIIFPILYGVLGFVVSLLFAWVYNAVAGIVGGVEVDIQ